MHNNNHIPEFVRADFEQYAQIQDEAERAAFMQNFKDKWNTPEMLAQLSEYLPLLATWAQHLDIETQRLLTQKKELAS